MSSSPPMPEGSGKGGHLRALAAIFCGMVGIAVLVPLMQWFDRGSLASDPQLDVPNPFGVGLLMGFVLVNALVLLLAKRRLVSNQTILILYVMLSVALPFCHVGLVGPLYANLQTSAREIFHRQEPGGMLHLYTWQNPDYYPKLPAAEFEYYMNLRDPDFVTARGLVDAKAESIETVKHLRQFWDGRFVTSATKERYANPAWGTRERVVAAWRDIPWSVWQPILLRWGAFALLLLLGTMCLAQLLHRDWTERESLPFPVVQAPLALLEQSDREPRGPALLANPFCLGGAAVSVLLLLLSGLAHYQIVDLPTSGAVTFQRLDFNSILVREPFSFVKNNYLFLSPLLIGIAYLVHQDILRGSLWVFAALQAARFCTGLFEESLSASLGAAWTGNKWPYYPELGTGAAIVFAAVLLWRSRHAFALRAGDESASAGYLPQWLGGVGLLVVVVALGILLYDFGVSGLGGLAVLFMLLVWTFVSAVALSRCRTEGGLAASGTTLVNNRLLLPGVGWASHLAPENVKALAHNEWLTVAAVPGVLCAQIEGLYMARRLKVRPRVLAGAVLAAGVTSLAVGLLSYLVLAHWVGGMAHAQRWFSGMAICMWRMGGDIVHRKAEADWIWCAVVLLGAVVMAALLLLRKRFPRFPLPPICLLIVCLGTVVFQTGQDSLHPCYGAGPYVCFVWGPMLVAFLAKKLVLRFGGMDLYVRTIPTAFGLVLGQVLMIVAWSLYHALVQPENIGLFTGIFS